MRVSRSVSLIGTIGPEPPEGSRALKGCASSDGPPQISINSSRKVAVKGSSYTPGFLTWPLTQYNFVPALCSVPTALYAAAPLAMIQGTLAIVSTLFTTVGSPYRPPPFWAGKGGRTRG